MRVEDLKKKTSVAEAEFQTKRVDLPLFVWIPEFISLAGSRLYDRKGREPNDLDVVVRAEQHKDGSLTVTLDPGLRLKMDRVMEENFGGPSVQWIGSQYGPNWKYAPLYDLVLRPKGEVTPRKIEEPDFAEKYYKLDLDQFRSSGIDEDLKNPKKHWEELFADLRYLGNSGYPKLKAGEKWGEWKMDDLLRYYAKIVDKLRSVRFPIIPPKMGDDKYKSSYWKAYREAKKYMKSEPPPEKDAKNWDEERKKILKSKSPYFSFTKVGAEEEKIAGGIVYSADSEDTQGDATTASELWKAMKKYMLKRGTVKVMHRGRKRDVPIVESYFAESEHRKGESVIPKNAWWMTVYLGGEPELWKLVKEGKLTGFSMGGTAKDGSRL